jgi:membrane-bound serine protease (ClpP class)
MPLWVSFVLLAAGILAIYVEIFVPAAGLIGLAGGGMIVAGVVLGYVNHDPISGSIVLFTALVVTPTAIVLGLKAFPRTPMGKRLILGSPDEKDDDDRHREDGAGATDERSERAPSHGSLRAGGEAATSGRDAAGERHAERPAADGVPQPGDQGEALTVLRPSGTARLGGRKLSVVTSGEWVDRGAPVKVMRVEGSRIVVREAPGREHGR